LSSWFRRSYLISGDFSRKWMRSGEAGSRPGLQRPSLQIALFPEISPTDRNTGILAESTSLTDGTVSFPRSSKGIGNSLLVETLLWNRGPWNSGKDAPWPTSLPTRMDTRVFIASPIPYSPGRV